MGTMDTNAVIEFFTENPRATAKEAGITNAEAVQLVGTGKLVEVGKRKTGKKGRPPAEYVVFGADLDDSEYVAVQVENAKAKVIAHRRYEALSTAIVRAADEHGSGSNEHIAAKLERWEAFPGALPELPTGTDYVLAGDVRYVAPDSTPLEVEVEEVAA